MKFKKGDVCLWTSKHHGSQLIIKVVSGPAPEGKVLARVVKAVRFGLSAIEFSERVESDIKRKRSLWFNIESLTLQAPPSFENK